MKRRNYPFIDRRGGNNKVFSDFIDILKKILVKRLCGKFVTPLPKHRKIIKLFNIIICSSILFFSERDVQSLRGEC